MKNSEYLDEFQQWVSDRDNELSRTVRRLDLLLDADEIKRLEKQRERLATALNVVDEFQSAA